MGAQLPFEEAVGLVARLTLVEVCPNTCQEATEGVGQIITQKEQQAVKATWDVRSSALPSPPEKIPERLYVSIDGTTVHTREEGWKEIKVGAFYCYEHASAGEAVQQAITYYTNSKDRMRYPEYRAEGLQIGSGTVESGCKHVIGARLKGAGMIWNVEGARAVARVRARLSRGAAELRPYLGRDNGPATASPPLLSTPGCIV